ncbi:MAG: hypothetical protein WBA99_11535, partial [Nodosilinea sp.]
MGWRAIARDGESWAITAPSPLKPLTVVLNWRAPPLQRPLAARLYLGPDYQFTLLAVCIYHYS